MPCLTRLKRNFVLFALKMIIFLTHTFQGVLESPDDFNSSEDVYEAVGSVLLDSSQDPTDEEGIRDLCALLLGALKG